MPQWEDEYRDVAGNVWDCGVLSLAAAEILGIKYWPVPGQPGQGEEEGYETASSI